MAAAGDMSIPLVVTKKMRQGIFLNKYSDHLAKSGFYNIDDYNQSCFFQLKNKYRRKTSDIIQTSINKVN